jgi:hypothetical protein
MPRSVELPRHLCALSLLRRLRFRTLTAHTDQLLAVRHGVKVSSISSTTTSGLARDSSLSHH